MHDDETFTRFHAMLLHAYTARGAEWLDANVPPGWAAHLLAFLPGIHMQNPNECIVGTLLRTDFTNGVGTAAGFARFDAFLEKHGLGNGGQYGFNTPTESWALGEDAVWDNNNSKCWSTLLEAWQHEILLRVTPDEVAVTIGKLEAKALAQGAHASSDTTAEALEEAQAAYNQAESAREDAESERDEARDALDEAKNTFEEARDTYSSACTEEEEAQEALTAARKAHEEATRDHVDYEAAITQLQQYLRTHNPLPVFP